MKDEIKAKFFRDLISSEIFQAQIALEEETYSSLLNRLALLDLTNPQMMIEYATIRGSLDALKGLKAKRARLAEEARSRTTNS